MGLQVAAAGKIINEFTGLAFAGGEFETDNPAIRFVSAEAWTRDAQGAHITFATAPVGTSSPVEGMRLTSEGILLVGTDTASGSAKLQVAGAFAFSGKVTTSSTVAGDVIADLINLSATGYGLRIQGGSSGKYALAVNDYQSNNLLLVDGVGELQFPNTVSKDRIIIFDSGSGHRYGLGIDAANLAFFANGSGGGFSWRKDSNAGASLASLTYDGTFTIYNQTGVAANTALVIRAGVTQSSALTLWLNNAGTAMSYISTSGEFCLQNNTTNYMVVENRSGGTDNGNYGLYMNHTAESLSVYAGSSKTVEVKKDKVGFFGVTPVARAAAPTGADNSALNTGDATSDAVIGNMRTRLGEVVTALQNIGLLS